MTSTVRRSQRARVKPCLLTYDGHPLTDVVEVQDSQEVVDHLLSHLYDGDGLWGPRAEHEAQTSGRRHKSALIW